MNDEDFRDVCAMFALTGLIMNGNHPFVRMHGEAYKHADAMLEARNTEPEEEAEGIAVIKKRKYVRKT